MRPKYSFFRTLFYGICFAAVSSSVMESKAYSLDCGQVRQLTQYYLKMHFGYSEFNDELSKRSLDLLIKSWDPGKLYFLQSDIERFEAAYLTKIDDMVSQANCAFIDDIVATYGKRFGEQNSAMGRLIDLNHDYTVDEYMEVDRKKLPWAKTTEELVDRWRKRIKFQALQLRETIADPKKVTEKLVKRQALIKKRHDDTTRVQIFGIFLNAFAMALDPHSDYMGPDELEDFRINTRLSLEGIGAVLRSEDGFTTIQSLVPGGAASQSGLVKVDDKIVAVAQGEETPVDVIDMDLRDVVKLIRGKENTPVKLTIVREQKGENTKLVVALKRQKVQLVDRAAKSRVELVDIKEGSTSRQVKVGVITLPSFYMDFEGREQKQKNFKSSSADMLREIERMKAKGIESLIVDLRNNGGGSLDESVNVTGLFIAKGPVVQVKGNDGGPAVLADRDPTVSWDGPLTVIINRQSASASEIFAGAIQDYGRGIIVGDSHTFGKGSVQNLNDLSEKLGAVKVTISKFYRPGGASTQLKGVEADIVFPDLMDEIEIGEKFYDYALPWEKIKASDYKPVSQVASVMPKLKEASAARLLVDEDFKLIAEDIKTYKEREVERSRISLKEKSAKEKAEEKEKLERRNGKRHGKQSDAEPSEADSDDMELQLIDDPHMQEALRVSADYLQISRGKMLAKLTLPGVIQAKKERDKADKKLSQKQKKN
jgi:carboxyl-terminal processing protease